MSDHISSFDIVNVSRVVGLIRIEFTTVGGLKSRITSTREVNFVNERLLNTKKPFFYM